MEREAQLVTVLNDEDLLCRLAYLTGIFRKVNVMNLSLQGKSVTVFDTYAKVTSYNSNHVLVRLCAKGTSRLLSFHKKFLE